jgi:hypothetical protein
MFGIKVLRKRDYADLVEDFDILADGIAKRGEEASTAWAEVGRLGSQLAAYDADTKARVDADERVQEAERRWDIAAHRLRATEVFFTDLLAGAYDEGLQPVPTSDAEADL